MPGPIRALRFIHNAIRVQASEVERLCAECVSPAAAAETVTPAVAVLNSAVRGHVIGEDEGYFPTLRGRLPHAADSFQFDHDDEEQRLVELETLAANCESDADLAALRRVAIVVREHLDLHMTKEEEILWPLTEEHFTPPEQGAMVGAILAVLPKDSMPSMIPWVVELQTPDEAVAYVRMLRQAQPAEVFGMFLGWIRSGVSEQRWSELVAAIPEIG